jgi:hypothetical protein
MNAVSYRKKEISVIEPEPFEASQFSELRARKEWHQLNTIAFNLFKLCNDKVHHRYNIASLLSSNPLHFVRLLLSEISHEV